MRPVTSRAGQFGIVTLALAATASSTHAQGVSAAAVARAERTVTTTGLLRDIRLLSSDRFAGRAPGTRGEDSTIAYLTARFRGMGLAPGNPDGSYIQHVPLVGITSTARVHLRVGPTVMTLQTPDQIVAWSMHPDTLVAVHRSGLIFVGYGVTAPEYHWDDYKGVDVRGKTLVMLVGDPPVRDPHDTTQLDSTMFRGKAMTYYGRWTYKYEEAMRRGAAAAIIVHETGPAGYGWAVVASSNGHEQFDVVGDAPAVPIESWIQHAVARKLFAAGGHDFDALERLARTRAFHPVELGGTATFVVHNRIRHVASRNVIAKLPGSDPALRNQYVMYTAHWDHFGIRAPVAGDSIYNGALDNASGVAWLLATAREYRALPRPPRRTILFMAVTAEEAGLLGARYYAQHPLYPLARTLADINMDIMNPWGRTRAVVNVSSGQSSLDGVLAREAAEDGRVVRPDPEPEKGYFYRSDHFELSRAGVPALAFLFPGADYIGKPAGYGQRMRAAYVAHDYHRPSDEIKPDWDLSGAVDDTRLLFRVGLDVANGSTWPAWDPGSEFRAARERMLRRGSE